MMAYDHVHGYIRVRLPWLFVLLGVLHLPRLWLVESGEAPHDPECTKTTGVLRSEGD